MASPGTIRFVEINTVPAAPPVGSAIIYVKTDNVIYLQDSNGIEVALGTASGITSLNGEATATGPGASTVTLSNSAVIGKILTGFTSGPNSSVLATDTLLQAIQKLQAQVSIGVGSAITSLTGDVTSTGPGSAAATVVQVGGKSASSIASAVDEVVAATPNNTASTIVERDASGNFSANTITANLAGNATTATSTTSFSGSLVGDVTGTQGATIVSTVGGKSAAAISSAVDDVQNATSINTASTLVERDASGNFAANTITANLTGTASGNEAPIIATTVADYYRGDKTFQPLNKTAVGLPNVDNTSDINKPISTATQAALDLKQDAASAVTLNGVQTLTNKTLTAPVINNPTGIVKADVGLSNVDNTSDINKPVSTAQAAADAAVQAFSIQRANHTGTQAASTISDFTEAAQDAVGASLADSATIDLNYDDTLNQISASVVPASIGNTELASNIDAAKIANGSVSNTEFQRLNGVTSDIQTQINSKVAKAGDTMTGELEIVGNNGVEFSGVRVSNTNLTGFSAINANADDGEVVQIAALNSLGSPYGTWLPSEFGLFAKRSLNITTDTTGAEIRFSPDTGGTWKAKVAADGKLHSQGVVLTSGTVQNVPTPVAGTDAANKNYADTKAALSHAANHLPSGSDPLATAAPLLNITASSTNVEGSEESFSRSDHNHAVSTGVAVTQLPDQVNSSGISADLAKADHIHFIPAAIPVNIGTSNFKGAAASFALSDHVHAHGNQTGPTLHAIVTNLANGFMSAADKIKLDASTSANTASTIVQRDASGNFSAGTITANLTGNVSGSSASFTGNLNGDVSGTQSATVVDSIGGKTSVEVSTSVDDTQAATDAATFSTIVKRDNGGKFSAVLITSDLAGNVTGAASDNLLKAGDTMTGYFRSAIVPLVDGVSIPTDVTLGNTFTVTLGGNRTLANPTGMGSSRQKATWVITQDATGGRTLAFGSAFSFGIDLAGLSLSTSPNATDYIGAMYNPVTSKWDVIAISRGH